MDGVTAHIARVSEWMVSDIALSLSMCRSGDAADTLAHARGKADPTLPRLAPTRRSPMSYVCLPEFLTILRLV